MRPTPRSEYRQKYESPDILEDGQWVVTRGVKVWEPSKTAVMPEDVDDEEADVQAIRADIDAIACPYCFATMAEHCRTKSGKKASEDHPQRLTKRVCQCGAPLAFRCELCPPCRYESDLMRQRDYKRRTRGAA